MTHSEHKVGGGYSNNGKWMEGRSPPSPWKLLPYLCLDMIAIDQSKRLEKMRIADILKLGLERRWAQSHVSFTTCQELSCLNPKTTSVQPLAMGLSGHHSRNQYHSNKSNVPNEENDWKNRNETTTWKF